MTKGYTGENKEQDNSLFELVVKSDLTVYIELNLAVFVGVLVIGVMIFFAVRKLCLKIFDEFEIDEAELGIGDQKLKLVPNKTDTQIAYKIWVELSTRKIGLQVDLEKDVIAEVYNSWYEFFKVTRELIKEVPATKLKREDTRKIIKLSIQVLNSGVRPHLTQWQACFRRWYERELEKEEDHLLSPQEIQKKYPLYVDLTTDLVEVNEKLIQYRRAMAKLVIGKCY